MSPLTSTMAALLVLLAPQANAESSIERLLRAKQALLGSRNAGSGDFISMKRAGNCKHDGLADIPNIDECRRACAEKNLEFSEGEWIHSNHCWYPKGGNTCHWNNVPYPPEIDENSRQLCMEPMTCEGSKTYEFVFDGVWNRDNFPIGFPTGAHISQFSVAAHSSPDYSMYKVGGMATPGMERKAEFGIGDILDEELWARKMEGVVYDYAISDVAPVIDEIENGIGETQERTVRVTVDKDHPWLSGSAMIAPSSAWFIGFDTVSMCNQATGEWVDEMTLPTAPVFDAGTDDGHCFECDDSDSDLPMSVLYCDGLAFCNSDEDDTLVDLGMFTFTQVDDSLAKIKNKLAAFQRKIERKQAEKEAAMEPATMDMRRAEISEYCQTVDCCIAFRNSKTCEGNGSAQGLTCVWKYNSFCRTACSVHMTEGACDQATCKWNAGTCKEQWEA